MSAFAQWLLSAFNSLVSKLYNAGVDVIQGGIDGVAALCVSLIALLPAGDPLPSGMPAAPVSESWLAVIRCINWLFPMQYLVTCVTFLVTGLLAYIAIAPLMKWLK